MLEYKDLDEYLDAVAAHPTEDLSLVPVPLLAENDDVTTSAIYGRINRGTLEEIRVGKQRFVSRRSLMRLRVKRLERIEQTEKFLMELAAKGEVRTFYEPVMENVGLTWRLPADRDTIGWDLGAVSRGSYARDKVLLSVLVHRKGTGATMPSAGFFYLAEDLGFDISEESEPEEKRAFVEEQTRLVLEKYASRSAA